MKRAVAFLLVAGLAAAPALGQTDDPEVVVFFEAASPDPEVNGPARAEIAAAWRDGYAAMLVDLIDLLQRVGFVNPEAFVRLAGISRFLEAQTGQSFGGEIDAWRRYVWSLPYEPHPRYGEFKGQLYSAIDPRFAEFFPPGARATIRIDEIQWGGVAVNGIPPLEHPEHVEAAAAGYLADDDIVFGIAVDGDARAYPKRILAWHELALDTLGGRELTIVYCTLCGTVIPFESRVGGEVRTFGTSGLLYRSNKLMFDAGTRSLWSSLTGTPVVGPLVGSGLELTPLAVVTTTWGEWRADHPATTVLSLDTGFERDYSEGAAYRAYFATDALMFDVSLHDGRLANKAEVLVLRPPGAPAEGSPGGSETAADAPLAISADFLRENPVYGVELGGRRYVIVTSTAGANRVYAAGERRFELAADGRVVDSQGRAWMAGEAALVATFDAALELPRVPAHRAFWFGWYAQHPDTRLIR